MGGCVSDIEKRVSPERTKEAKKKVFNPKIDRNSSSTEKNPQKENYPFLNFNQIVGPNRQGSTKAHSQNEDPDFEEIRNETKAKIIRKGKKKNVNLNDHQIPQAKSYSQGPQKMAQNLKKKEDNAEENNSQKQRASSRNSFELAQNSVYVSKQKEPFSDAEKQQKISKEKHKQENQDLYRQYDQNLGESYMAKSKVQRLKQNSAVEDLPQEEKVKSPQKQQQQEMLQGSSIEDKNGSTIITIENVSYSIPRQRAGPLIVSKIDYSQYQI